MKKNEERELLTLEELEQLRGGFSDDYILSEEEDTEAGNGNFCKCNNKGQEKVEDNNSKFY